MRVLSLGVALSMCAIGATVGCRAQVSIGDTGGDSGPFGEGGTPSGGDIPSGGPTPAGIDAAPDDGNGCASIEQRSLEIRKQSCAMCHDATSDLGGFGSVMDDVALLAARSTKVRDDAGSPAPLVVPGDAANSSFYSRTASGTMPPGPLNAVTASDLSVLAAWIDHCLGARPTASNDSGPAGDGGPPDPGDADAVSDGPGDAAADVGFDVMPAPPGLAGFALIVNGIVQSPLHCPSENWEFQPVDGTGRSLCGNQIDSCYPQYDAGGFVTSAFVMNTGLVPVAYIMEGSGWQVGAHYVPGVTTGTPNELVGVLDPGGRIDITSNFTGSVAVLFGAAKPFSQPAGKYAYDEGTIPWPAGVAGGQGAAQMWIAELEVRSSCGIAQQLW